MMIRVDARTLTALYDRRIDLSAGTAAAHPDDTTVGAVRAVGQVEAVLPDGRFRVSLLNQILNLALPPATQPGDRVPMRLVAGAWVPSTAETEASSNVGSTATATTALAAPGEPEPQISAAVRLLAELSASETGSGTPARVNASGSLLAAPPQEPKELARAIREAIVTSGLFYESHQAEWVAGERSLGELRAEPQGRLPPLPPQASLAGTPPPAMRAASQPLSLSPLPAGIAGGENRPADEYQSIAALARRESGTADGKLTVSPDAIATLESRVADVYQSVDLRERVESVTEKVDQRDALSGNSASSSDLPSKSAAPAAQGPVHSDALPLVRQQLEVLAQPAVIWQGELWPGQTGQIEIHDERPGPDTPPENATFATHITLTLPRLGEVEATLRVQGSRLQLRLRGAGGTASEMRSALTSLDEALAALGLPSRDITVSPHEL